MEFTVQGGGAPAILAKGEIVEGDAARFRHLLDAPGRKPSVVSLVSPGGRLDEGMALGSLIREHGLATRVGRSAICASACVHAFLGGVIREADPSGRIGVHMATLVHAKEYIAKLRQVLTTRFEDVDIDRKIQFIVALNEQHGAQLASAQANYVLRMGVSLRLLETVTATDHDDVHWLTRSEMRDFNVTNTE